jgi:hypothetical protein
MELIDRVITPSGWRDSTYRRADGTTFRVAVPERAWVGSDGNPERYDYDEEAEQKMAVSLASRTPRGNPALEMPDPSLRPEVLAAEKRAAECRAEAEECEAWADWWAQLSDHGHDGEFCDDEDCYQAWHEYPDG